MKRLVLLILVLFTVPLAAQEVLTSGLLAPTKIIFSPGGDLLVAEAGNANNSGRVSLIDRASGERRTLIGGLPSGFTSAEGAPSPSGPSGLAVLGNTLYVLIGEGDAVQAGPAPGSARPNPSPASAMRSALLAFDFAGPIDEAETIELTAANRTALAAGSPISVTSASARVVADFADYREEPRPDFGANVRASNPFGIALLDGVIYIADAGWNSIRRVDRITGATSTVTEFAPIANPAAGPPFVDAVPDSIRADGDRLLVTLLTGFPFVPGLSRAVAVNPANGTQTIVAAGLSSAIDIVPVGTGNEAGFVISEFSTSLGSGAPGRITFHAIGDDEVVTLAPSIVSPSSMAIHPTTRELYVTQIFTGNVVRIDASDEVPAAGLHSIIPVVARLDGAHGSDFQTNMQLTNTEDFGVAGELLFHGADGMTRRATYTLAAHETIEYDNALALVIPGAATVDVRPISGPAPRIITRIFDRSRNNDATGAIIEQVPVEDALRTGDRAVLIGSNDAQIARTNVGIRALEDSIVRWTLRRADGDEAAVIGHGYTANQLAQYSISALFGVPSMSNDSIHVEVVSGSAIVYASTVNNVTQESSWQRGVAAGR